MADKYGAIGAHNEYRRTGTLSSAAAGAGQKTSTPKTYRSGGKVKASTPKTFKKGGKC